MKTLLATVGWLEFVRVKNRIWLLLSLIVALSFLLSSCGPANINVNIETHSTQQSWHMDSPFHWNDADLPDDVPALPYTKLPQIVPSAAITFWILTVGYLVLLTVPFRNRQEWENGMFQMVAMGDHRLHRVELARFISYLLLASVFFLCVSLCYAAYVWKYHLLPMQLLFSVQIVLLYLFVAWLPLLLAFGVLVSAINTAYYRDGHGRLLAFMKFLGCGSFLVLLVKCTAWFGKPEHNLLPMIPVSFNFSAVSVHIVHLSWIFPILSLALAATFIFWAGRVLEEVEA